MPGVDHHSWRRTKVANDRAASVVASSTTPSTLSSLPTRIPPFAEIGVSRSAATPTSGPMLRPEAWAIASSNNAFVAGVEVRWSAATASWIRRRFREIRLARERSLPVARPRPLARPRSAFFAWPTATTIPDRGDDQPHDAGDDEDAEAPVGAYVLPQLGLGHPDGCVDEVALEVAEVGLSIADPRQRGRQARPSVQLSFVSTELVPCVRGRGEMTMHADAVTVVVDP